MRRQRLRVELRLDGELQARYQGRYVAIGECGARTLAVEPKTSNQLAKITMREAEATGCGVSLIGPVRRYGVTIEHGQARCSQSGSQDAGRDSDTRSGAGGLLILRSAIRRWTNRILQLVCPFLNEARRPGAMPSGGPSGTELTLAHQPDSEACQAQGQAQQTHHRKRAARRRQFLRRGLGSTRSRRRRHSEQAAGGGVDCATWTGFAAGASSISIGPSIFAGT